jgi:hypothetical protein
LFTTGPAPVSALVKAHADAKQEECRPSSQRGSVRLIAEAQAIGSVRLFSVRQEFPAEWAKFLSQTPAAGQRYELTLEFRREHYPFWGQSRLNGVTRVDMPPVRESCF